MIKEERLIEAPDGAKLNLTVFSPAEEGKRRGALLLVHGFGEHAGRYAHVAEFFSEKGLVCYIHDQRGHGKTPGARGVAGSYDLLLDDVREVLRLIRAEHPGVPVALYGHSMGGNIALNYLAGRDTEGIRCAVVSSPWLRLYKPVPGAVVSALSGVSRLLPSYSVRTKLALSLLTHDAEIVKRTEDDPLYHNVMGVRLFKGIISAGEAAIVRAADIKLPTLLMAAEDDRIVSVQAEREFSERAGGNVVFHVWPGAYHELHNEPERRQVLEYAWEFIGEHIPPRN